MMAAFMPFGPGAVATCYTPQQLEVAYGVQPLLRALLSERRPGHWLDARRPPTASAPLWAGIIALADQYAQRHLGFVNPAIYQIARSSQYHQAFHDVTAGNSNTAEFPPTTIAGYRAGPGWDPVTGWGSPDAQVLIPLLARSTNIASAGNRRADITVAV
jgi:subtilase family serine protease